MLQVATHHLEYEIQYYVEVKHWPINMVSVNTFKKMTGRIMGLWRRNTFQRTEILTFIISFRAY